MRIFYILTLLLVVFVSAQQSPRGEITPPGIVRAFGMSTCPSGWVAADGIAKSSTIYSKLDSAFGTTWGARSGGNFQIPNLAGSNRFLRAAGGSLTVGTEQTDATKKNGLAVSGGTASLTGTTTFASDGHTHTAGSIAAAIGAIDGHQGKLGYIASGVPSGAWTTTTAYMFTMAPHVYAIGSVHTFSHYTPTYGTMGGNNAAATVGISSTAAALSNGDAETRPASAVVLYCIKY